MLTKYRILGVVAMFSLVSLVAWFFFSNPTVRLSQSGYEIAKSLYAACNLKDPRRLEALRATVDAISLAEEERSQVIATIELAEGGQWDKANEQARRLLQSQDTP